VSQLKSRILVDEYKETGERVEDGDPASEDGGLAAEDAERRIMMLATGWVGHLHPQLLLSLCNAILRCGSFVSSAFRPIVAWNILRWAYGFVRVLSGPLVVLVIRPGYNDIQIPTWTTSLPGEYRYMKSGRTYKLTSVGLWEYMVTKRILLCGISL